MGLRSSGAGTLGVPLEGTRRVGELRGRRKAVSDRFALQGGRGDFP